MSHAMLRVAAAMQANGEPFVLATVVWRRGPSSGKQGAKAIVDTSGRLRGWIGGACAEPTIVREALGALGDGKPRLLFIGPAEERDGRSRPGITSVPMACESEGAMEVYLEPVLPHPAVVIVGRSPAVDTLATMAASLEWHVTIVDDGGSSADHPDGVGVVTNLDLSGVDERTLVVVATQGHYDEVALEAALATSAGYIGLVASRKRADGVLEYLRSRGVTDEDLSRVHAPAGLDLGRVRHEEMAVAVLAELVATRAGGGIVPGVSVSVPRDAVDPVCGMTVNVAAAKFTTEHAGGIVYFCAAGCQRAFETHPDEYVTIGEAE